MQTKVVISILIPTYNRPVYLKECLDSVISQVGFNNSKLEFIVSDNSDNDETKVLIEGYIRNNPNKILKYHKNEINLGMIGNWNKLLELKSGELFIYLSDDDKFYDENCLKKLYDSLLKNNLDAIYGNRLNIDDKGKDLGFVNVKDFDQLVSYNEILNNHTIGFGGVLYKDYGFKFDLKCSLFSDWQFNLFYLKKGFKFQYINENIFKYRVHNYQTVNTISKFQDLKMYYNILKTLNVSNFSFFYLFFRRFLALYFLWLKNFFLIKNIMLYLDNKLKLGI